MNKKFKLSMALIFVILTLTLGRFVAWHIEAQSIRKMLDIDGIPSRSEIGTMLSDDDPFILLFLPAVKITRVSNHFPCEDSAGEQQYGTMQEVVFLTYWGIPTPLWGHDICGFVSFGKIPASLVNSRE